MLINRAMLIFLALFLTKTACQESNHPPAIDFVADQLVSVETGLRLVVIARDPDNDPLSFSVKGLPEEARIVARSRQEALLDWKPTAADTEPGGRSYDVIVLADDGLGGVATSEFTVTVTVDAGRPVFELASGVVLNLAQEQDLTTLIEVKDDDSLDVSIELLESPSGTKLQASGTKSAWLYWRPNEEQREIMVHRVVLQATDESHDPVKHTLNIVLLNTEKDASCQGSAPNILHSPPHDESLEESGLTLSATIIDAESAISEAMIYWSSAPDPTDRFAALSMSESEKVAGLYSATLQPDLASQNGLLVHYYLEAVDNDDPTASRCDLKTRYPKSGWLTTAVYPHNQPISGCVDDPNEPDDTLAQAPTISPGIHPGQRACASSPDLRKLDVPAGQQVLVSLYRSPEHGDLSLQLLDTDGSLLGEDGNPEANTLQVGDASLEGGTRYIQVENRGGNPGSSYVLYVSFESGSCEDDPAESNNTLDSATPISAGVQEQLVICPGDEDWFRIALNQDQRVTASLQFDHQYGDLDMEFVDGDGKRILSAASEGSTESLSFTAETSAPIYVRVFGHEGASNAYVMTVSIETVDSGSCTEDLFGSHTSPEEAIVAYIGYYRELVSCAGQPDWFAVDLNGGETFDVIAQQPNNDSVLTVDIFKPGEENPVATGVSDSSGLARASYVLTGPSRLLYRISSLGSVDYALLTQVTDPIGEQCSEDRYEPNDDPENAHPVEPGVHTWLRLCGNEQDVFSVNLEAFDRLIAVTSHSDGLGYGDLEIRGPDGQELVAQAVGGEHGGVVEALADAPGVYTITVVGFGVSEALPYDIAIFLE